MSEEWEPEDFSEETVANAILNVACELNRLANATNGLLYGMKYGKETARHVMTTEQVKTPFQLEWERGDLCKLAMSTRLENILWNWGVATLSQLASKSRWEMLHRRQNAGIRTVREAERILAEHGLSFSARVSSSHSS